MRAMHEEHRRQLAFHGAIAILLGLIAGFPYAFVILGQMSGDLRAWRMAHLEGVLNGLLLWAAAGIGAVLRLGESAQQVVVWALVVTAYGNTLAAILGATTGQRGLEPGGTPANMTVYLLFMVALVAVFVAVGAITSGARRRR
jgi:dolichol kinase